eukprot:TRINITY_DN136273_c0_g1_i1.p2 TRINITY_DN136273_c0_g1~~TRINITY_DN136273_c0_g1_i1.p2  ORF type:complete len:441 (+),score=62.58 TRINITY_DN136273_c0_g1_i1:1705-3027(+)
MKSPLNQAPSRVFHRANSVSVNNNGFLLRNENFLLQREYRIKSKTAQIVQNEKKQCTFRPSINHSHVPSGKGFPARLLDCSHKTEAIAKLKAECERKEAEEIHKNCTFRPKIHSQNATSKYMESTKRICTERSISAASRTRSQSLADSNYTFRPVTNKVYKCMLGAKQYLKLNPYERLSKKVTDAQKVLEKYKKCEEGKLCEENKVELDQKDRLKDFYARLDEFNAKREEHKKRILEETYIDPTPKINRSMTTVKSMVLSGKEVKPEVSKQSEYTFHPEILPQSKNLKRKTASEMSYGPLVMKEMKLNDLKQGFEERERLKCTFTPVMHESKKYGMAQSKLQLKENMETYLERVSLIKKQKETEAAIQKQKKEYKEVVECTYHPKIKEMPYYVKIKAECEKDKSTREMRREAYYSKIHGKNNSQFYTLYIYFMCNKWISI